MFTGLIEETGKVKSINRKGNSLSIEVEAEKILEDTKIGDSIAINGVCLTVVSIKDRSFSFDVSKETLDRSNFKQIKIGEVVNLERALKVSDRLGGHIVQGHVDTTGKIIQITPLGEHTAFVIEIPERYTHFIVEKGSIAVDGISLTINSIEKNRFSLNIIPHTLEETNLKYRKVGDTVNIEFDIIGKYVFNMLKNRKDTNLSLEKLLENF
jgi:riboflavin synthase